jgi:phosphopantothenoylcysteine decarboxylase/phosphopantothenate--cysteine ligase
LEVLALLNNKNIVLGITGGIAAYKAADFVSSLKKLGANVFVIMTKSACEFITPLTMRSLSQNPVAVSTFDEPKHWEIAHISLAEKANAFVVAPATANIIGKIAGGIADDMLTTTLMAAKAPVVIAPAMNTNMYENPIVTENIQKLKRYGYLFVNPRVSRLACGTVGVGALADIDDILEGLIDALTTKDMKGLKVLVTAGPTVEKIDPVRFITNHSSGKMGVAIAAEAKRRGAEVTLVSGPVSVKVPGGITNISVNSALDMQSAVLENFKDADIVVKAAAVADFRSDSMQSYKIKKENADMQINLVKNPDILKELGETKGNKILVGFCMETENLIENGKKKLLQKNADMIVANSLNEENAGFGVDTNTVTIITKDTITPLPNMAKTRAAKEILDRALMLKREAQC